MSEVCFRYSSQKQGEQKMTEEGEKRGEEEEDEEEEGRRKAEEWIKAVSEEMAR